MRWQGSYFRRQRTGAGARRRWAERWWPTRCARSTRPGRWLRSKTPTGARAIWCTFAGWSKPGWQRRTRRYLLPAAGWNRCTGTCASCTRAKKPASTLCSRRLRGAALLNRLEAWADNGVIEPSCADAVRTVAAHPEWLGLPGRTVALLGAGAEVGPLPALLSWGAHVIAI